MKALRFPSPSEAKNSSNMSLNLSLSPRIHRHASPTQTTNTPQQKPIIPPLKFPSVAVQAGVKLDISSQHLHQLEKDREEMISPRRNISNGVPSVPKHLDDVLKMCAPSPRLTEPTLHTSVSDSQNESFRTCSPNISPIRTRGQDLASPRNQYVSPLRDRLASPRDPLMSPRNMQSPRRIEVGKLELVLPDTSDVPSHALVNRIAISDNQWKVTGSDSKKGVVKISKDQLLHFSPSVNEVYVRPISNFNGTKNFKQTKADSDIRLFVHENTSPMKRVLREEVKLINTNHIMKGIRNNQAKRYFSILNRLPLKCKAIKRIMDLYKVDDVMYAVFILITALYKGYKVRKQIREMKLAAVKIQQWWRTTSTNLFKNRETRLKEEAQRQAELEEKVERLIKERAVKVIEETYKKAKEKKERMQYLITKLQARVRSNLYFKKVVDMKVSQECIARKMKLCKLYRTFNEPYEVRTSTMLFEPTLKCLVFLKKELDRMQSLKPRSKTVKNKPLRREKYSVLENMKHLKKPSPSSPEYAELVGYCKSMQVPLNKFRRLRHLVSKLFKDPTSYEKNLCSAKIFFKYHK